MTKCAYPDGIDCVWLASDRNGHLGAFVTGGIGPIPMSALSGESLSIEEVEEAVCGLPQVSEVRLLVQMKRPDDFIAMAERGFFVYDWRDVHRTTREFTHAYEPIALPLSPITTDALPEPLKRLAVDANLSSLTFVEGQALDVRNQFECCSVG